MWANKCQHNVYTNTKIKISTITILLKVTWERVAFTPFYFKLKRTP